MAEAGGSSNRTTVEWDLLIVKALQMAEHEAQVRMRRLMKSWLKSSGIAHELKILTMYKNVSFSIEKPRVFYWFTALTQHLCNRQIQ